MKVLFILPDFYGYNTLIKNKLFEQGVDAILINDGPKESLFFRILKKMSKSISNAVVNHYYKKKFSSLSNLKFNKIVLVFGGKYFSKKIFYMMKSYFPNSETIYYNWDSCENFPNVLGFYNLFDHFYSFDAYDCKKYRFTFLPLFFTRRNLVQRKKNTCLSIMTFSHKKAKNYYTIKKIIPKNIIIEEFLYLGHISTFLFNKVFRFKEFKKFKKNDFIYNKISLEDTLNLISNSKFVIDIALPNQHGLTIRTFEALANGTKIITNNKEIKNYPFYTSQNIYILEDENDINFFYSDFNFKFLIDDSFCIDHFLKKLLSM